MNLRNSMKYRRKLFRDMAHYNCRLLGLPKDRTFIALDEAKSFAAKHRLWAIGITQDQEDTGLVLYKVIHYGRGVACVYVCAKESWFKQYGGKK